MKRSSKAERRAHVAAWRQSGLSRSAYCRQQRLNYNTFVTWIEAEAPAPAAGNFIELSAPAAEAGVLRIEFPNGIRLEYRGEVSVALVQALRHA